MIMEGQASQSLRNSICFPLQEQQLLQFSWLWQWLFLGSHEHPCLRCLTPSTRGQILCWWVHDSIGRRDYTLHSVWVLSSTSCETPWSINLVIHPLFWWLESVCMCVHVYHKLYYSKYGSLTLMPGCVNQLKGSGAEGESLIHKTKT